MTQPNARDPFYGICAVAAVLLLSAAIGVPALWGQPTATTASAQPAKMPAVKQAISNKAESMVGPLTQLLQPATVSGHGV